MRNTNNSKCLREKKGVHILVRLLATGEIREHLHGLDNEQLKRKT